MTTTRPPPSKLPADCIHIHIDRLNEDEKAPVLSLNGHGMLRPMLVCKDCGIRFYIVDSETKHIKKKS